MTELDKIWIVGMILAGCSRTTYFKVVGFLMLIAYIVIKYFVQ